MRMSRGPGSRRSSVKGVKGAEASVAANPRTWNMRFSLVKARVRNRHSPGGRRSKPKLGPFGVLRKSRPRPIRLPRGSGRTEVKSNAKIDEFSVIETHLSRGFHGTPAKVSALSVVVIRLALRSSLVRRSGLLLLVSRSACEWLSNRFLPRGLAACGGFRHGAVRHR